MNSIILLVAMASFNVVRSVIDTAKIDSYLNAILGCESYKGRIGGMTINGVKDGKLLYLGNFGHASIKDNITFSNQTRFSIGSLSKSFTAYIVSNLVDQSKLEWHGVVTDYFNKYNVPFQLSGPFRNSRCTIKDAMTHQTGIKSYDILLGDNRTNDRSEWVKKIIPFFTEQYQFREMFYYNNWMYTVIGYLTELITGSVWEQQVRDEMLKPLGMTDTMFVSDSNFDDLTVEDIATPYNEDKDGVLYEVPISALKLISVNAPAGGMISTSNDMAIYTNALLAALNTKRETVLNSTVMSALVDNKVYLPYNLGHSVDISKPRFPETYSESSYGLGVVVGTYRGYKQVNHGGSAYGHYSFMMLLPEMDIGVFAFVSGCDYQSDNWKLLRIIMLYVVDVLLEVEPWLNDTTVCTYPEPWERDPTLQLQTIANSSSQAEDKYVGVYKRSEYQDLEVSIVDEHLMLKMGNVKGKLNYSKPDMYISYLEVPWFPHNLKEDYRMLSYISFVTDEGDVEKVTQLNFKFGIESFAFTRSKAPRLFDISSITLLVAVILWLQRTICF